MPTIARDIDDRERFTVTFTDINGAAADPTTVTIKVRPPDGATVTAVNTDSPVLVTNSGVGVYYYDYTYSQEGRHFIEWSGGGALVAAVSSERWVRRSNVT